MGNRKYVPPIPETESEMKARIRELEEQNALKRQRKAEAMQRWRERVRTGKIQSAST